MNKQLAAFLRQFESTGSPEADRYLGCHAVDEGFVFRVWAPHAQAVSVTGDFNFWNEEDLPMHRLGSSGVWEAVSKFAKRGSAYKYCVTGANGSKVYKADPYANRAMPLPETSSVVDPPEKFRWTDAAYRRNKLKQTSLQRPVNIYEVHAGSWKRHDDGSYLSYEELAAELIPYVKDMGYTHIEFMPLMEYPYDPSWGYQVTGYYAPTHRYGSPEQLRMLVDACHAANIGVILDWVPAHFPKDSYGLYEFDGTCCYELSDPAMREHPDWGTRIYDYAKPEVRSFLISNVCYWLREFHIDGIRVDAVASMLYLDYNRPNYKPNRLGGRENLEAIAFLRQLNEEAFQADPTVMMIAEESTAFPMITRPGYDGGLGFLYKWNMGWMNDFLEYMKLDPYFKQFHHGQLCFSIDYYLSEKYVLVLSHDEVVHGKCSLLNKMPGLEGDKYATLRAAYGFFYGHPGKKLLFMGQEFAQKREWAEYRSLDWFLLDEDVRHRQMQDYIREWNRLYKKYDALYYNDFDVMGFEWMDCDHPETSTVAFVRRGRTAKKQLMIVTNFTPVEQDEYHVKVPCKGTFREILNSDEERFGGQGYCNKKAMKAVLVPKKGKAPAHYEICMKVPPLAAVVLEYDYIAE